MYRDSRSKSSVLQRRDTEIYGMARNWATGHWEFFKSATLFLAEFSECWLIFADSNKINDSELLKEEKNDEHKKSLSKYVLCSFLIF